jgi:hypothetical protein
VTKATQIIWPDEPDDHDYPAAESYLIFAFDQKTAATPTGKPRREPITHVKAKDVFRASGLSLLGINNSHVEKDSKKILEGKTLSPPLLVRDRSNARVIIADGYHRLCSVFSFDEDAFVPCKIV